MLAIYGQLKYGMWYWGYWSRQNIVEKTTYHGGDGDYAVDDDADDDDDDDDDDGDDDDDKIWAWAAAW